jgi:hypothetical protein
MTWDGWISIDIPDGWECDEDLNEKLVTIYQSNNGVGALQISFAWHRPPIGDAHGWVRNTLDSFLESYHADGGPNVTIGPNSTSQCLGHNVFAADGGHWEVWLWSSLVKRVFVTYNCSLEDHGIETQAYNCMVSSITWPK